PWVTMEGVMVGASLEDLESFNGRPFFIASYNLNISARSSSWEDGAIPAALSVEFRPEDSLTPDEIKQLSNQLSYRSDDPIIRKLRYKVRALVVTW
ncbi:MAG: hypothetical protein JO102_03035, partial [Elusimicrobia bacterium]|nr:hypothetical protein [Elusimicrobiota bacterium]